MTELHRPCHSLDVLWEDRFSLDRHGQGLPVYCREVSGHGDLEEVYSLVPGDMLSAYRDGSHSEQRIFRHGLTLFTFLNQEDGKIYLRAKGDKGAVDGLIQQLSEILRFDPPSGQVYVLVRGGAGFSLNSCGKIDTELRRQNYEAATLAGFDHVLSCLTSKTPCGRLIVMDGPPGTGKSFAIRAMICSMKATFVIVAPSLVGTLSGPDIVPCLLENGQAGPIVLIMEDADAALLNRRATGGDLNQLSEVLNLGDGLLGELMDVRIVATTNAGRVDLDKAVSRPGRLCRHVKFDALSSHAANRVYDSLVEDSAAEDTFFRDGTTLAEVYREARQDGWEPEKSKGSGGNYL